MKNNKGITITSLVIYIAIVIVVAATVIRITTYFKNNMEDAADVRFETEFQKINLYILTESKIIGNGIEEIAEGGTEITFLSENKFTYNAEDESIYLNDNIKICTNVQECKFSQKATENGKIAIALEIKIAEMERKEEYVIANYKTEQIINEIDYEWNTISNNTIDNNTIE